MARPEDRLVYSTDQPFEPQRDPKPKKTASGKAPPLPNDGVIRVARERRRASMVTIIHGVNAAELAPIARELQKTCGGGGSTKDGVIMLQGDHREAVVAYFAAQQRRVKMMGG